jgi:putative NADH-flavin reductase
MTTDAFVILGASGHVGQALVTDLLARGQDVHAVVHDPKRVDGLVDRGIRAVAVDIHDVEAARCVRHVDIVTGQKPRQAKIRDLSYRNVWLP